MITKVCSKCKIKKLLDEFFNDYKGKFGKQAHCKTCDCQRSRKYYQLNKTKIIHQHRTYTKDKKRQLQNYHKVYQLKNKNRINKRRKKYYNQRGRKLRKQYYFNQIKKNPNFNHERYVARKEKFLEEHKRYYKANKSKLNAQKNKYVKQRKQKDIGFKLLCALRIRIYDVLKGRTKSDTTKKFLGCSISKFKHHLESQFKKGMNWNNYGRKGWHIDHIKPCARFDLSKASDQRKCFHYSNLQPLWWYENLAKGYK